MVIVFDFRLKLSVYNERSGRSAIIDAIFYERKMDMAYIYKITN
jgi:hypothetical protein